MRAGSSRLVGNGAFGPVCVCLARSVSTKCAVRPYDQWNGAALKSITHLDGCEAAGKPMCVLSLDGKYVSTVFGVGSDTEVRYVSIRISRPDTDYILYYIILYYIILYYIILYYIILYYIILFIYQHQNAHFISVSCYLTGLFHLLLNPILL
jgi:hypothetical protein